MPLTIQPADAIKTCQVFKALLDENLLPDGRIGSLKDTFGNLTGLA